jgi:putative phosphoribosyl transferase
MGEALATAGAAINSAEVTSRAFILYLGVCCVVMPTSCRLQSSTRRRKRPISIRIAHVVIDVLLVLVITDATLLVMFHDRTDAGRKLAKRLEHLSGNGTLVLGLPRGGVPVAYEVAKTLHAPLDVLIVRKLGVPWHPELAFGAVGEGGVRVLNDDVIRSVGLKHDEVERTEDRERHEVEELVRHFRPEGERNSLRGRTAVIVDDGVATGATARAACNVARLQGAKRVVLAVPSAPSYWLEQNSDIADEIVAYDTTLDLGSVGAYYEHFSQVDDDTVSRLLRDARDATFSGEVRIPVSENEWMEGHLEVPFGAKGMVVFSHGSGSSRQSPRNKQVADRLNAAGFATLLFDLLTPAEADDRARRFDIELLSRRLGATIPWVRMQPHLCDLPIGLFGASTGAAAAIVAATRGNDMIRAIVSRGGRPDLAADYLERLRTPTLFIVGGDDDEVLELNREAIAKIGGPYSLSVVHGATHLFEEPGALESVIDEAVAYFAEHLA